jgi:hypothetical protein
MISDYNITDKDYAQFNVNKNKIGAAAVLAKRAMREVENEYNRYMNTGRYSKALEIAVIYGLSDKIALVEKTAKQFYAKYPGISEAAEYRTMKEILIKKSKENASPNFDLEKILEDK